MPAVVEQKGTKNKHRPCAISGPAHAGLVHTLQNLSFGSGFYGVAADGEARLSIGSVVHASLAFLQVRDRLFDFWRHLCEIVIETQDATEEKALLTAS